MQPDNTDLVDGLNGKQVPKDAKVLKADALKQPESGNKRQRARARKAAKATSVNIHDVYDVADSQSTPVSDLAAPGMVEMQGEKGKELEGEVGCAAKNICRRRHGRIMCKKEYV